MMIQLFFINICGIISDFTNDRPYQKRQKQGRCPHEHIAETAVRLDLTTVASPDIPLLRRC